MGIGIKRSTGGRRHRPMGEINVTPFVDVMLVLLIVFMVTAPLLTVGVEVDLPKTKAGAINADAAPLVVSIKSDGSLGGYSGKGGINEKRRLLKLEKVFVK